jgi:Membrane protein involved in the export of O-antigen and teichoic acid
MLRQIVEGSTRLTIATIVARVATFASSLFVVRELGANGLGRVALLTSWVQLTAMLTTVGLSTSLVRATARAVGQDRRSAILLAGTALAAGLALSTAAGIAIIAFSAVEYRWEAMANLEGIAPLLALWLIGLTLDKIASAILQGLQRFEAFVTVNLAVGLLTLPVTVVFVIKWHVYGAMVAAGVLASVQALGTVTQCVRALGRSVGRWQGRNHVVAIRRLMPLTIPAFTLELLTGPVQTFGLTVLAQQAGGISGVGLINAAGRFVNLIGMLPTIVAQTLTPALTEQWEVSTAQFARGMATATRVLFAVSIPIVVVVWSLSPHLLTVMYGASYREAWPVLSLLAAVSLLAALNEANDRAFLASNRLWLSMANNAAHLCLFAPLLLAFVPRFGAAGYATAYLIAFTLYVVLQTWWSVRLFAVTWIVPFQFGVFGAAVGIACAAINTLDSVAVSFAAMLTALGCTVWFCWSRLLAPSERHALLGRVRLLARISP